VLHAAELLGWHAGGSHMCVHKSWAASEKRLMCQPWASHAPAHGISSSAAQLGLVLMGSG